MDPACGTGGFLLQAYESMRASNKDKAKLEYLKTKALSGTDISPLVTSLCAMNLYLHGIGGNESPVKTGDSLLNLGSDRYDMVLTNPPFGKKSSTKIMGEDGSVNTQSESYERDDFIVSTSNKQINFLQHIMSVLKIGGKAAVVLPDNVLFEGGAGERVRKRLLKDFNLHTILRLPTGIFYAQGVKANVVFFDKYTPSDEYRTSEVWVYDLRTNQNFTLIENPLNDESLADFVKCYGDNLAQRKPSEKFKCFDIDEILKRDKTNLDISWIKDESVINSENIASPDEILRDIKANITTALSELEKIKL
ncbi:MAG: SAM-dependent methyltransferase [Campylobacter sp.]|nr:SAM-dependent methyltransferase [Campylobacter sp.]